MMVICSAMQTLENDLHFNDVFYFSGVDLEAAMANDGQQR